MKGLLVCFALGLSLCWITPAVPQQEVIFVRTGEITAWYKKYMGFTLARGVVDRECFLGECKEFGTYFEAVDDFDSDSKRCIVRFAGGLLSEYVGGITRPTLYNRNEKVTGNPDYISFSCVKRWK